MRIRNKLLLAISVPVGLLVLQIALVNVFVRELQDAVTFIAVTHETIEHAFTADDRITELRDEAKRLPSSFVTDREAGDEGLTRFADVHGALERHLAAILASDSVRAAAGESVVGLEAAHEGLRAELSSTQDALAQASVDMDTLLERAVFLDGALVRVSTALGALSRDLRGELQLAVDRERRIHNRPVIAGVAIGGLSIVMLLGFTWLVVDRLFVRRLTGLSETMLAIARGRLDVTVPQPRGRDEVDEMTRTVETFRVTTQERDALLSEQAQASERLEEEVAERTAELEQANRFKTRFLAAASHDVRQPLHAMNLFIGQLRETTEPAERQRLEDRIADTVTSMNALFDALLDMSKLEAGVLVPEIVPLPIRAVFDRLDATFGAAAAKKGLRLRMATSQTWVSSDPILLERILLNLVSNAVSATASGGIVVGCRRRGGIVRIDVCDTGPGIPEDQKGALFQEFFRLDATNPAKSERLGLGLSIVDGLARLLDHRIELQSTVGRGTRFSVHVPVASGAKRQETPARLHFGDRSDAGAPDPRDRRRPACAGEHVGDTRRLGLRRVAGRQHHRSNGSRDRQRRPRSDHFRLPTGSRADRHRRDRSDQRGRRKDNPRPADHRGNRIPRDRRSLGARLPCPAQTRGAHGPPRDGLSDPGRGLASLSSERCGRDHGLGPVRSAERAEDRGDMVLDGGLGDVERPTDGLVAHPLHHEF